MSFSRKRRSATMDGSDSEFGTPAAVDSPKRPRLDPEEEEEEEEEEQDQTSRSSRKSRLSNGYNVNGAGSDGFHAGAIVRVSVQNFITYEKADFFPGPNLNMVIGPNGTGKSSLVCAICLGLGFSPRLLARSNSFKEFVKHGKDIATIEIELKKRPEDRRNMVVKVQIRRESNSCKWWLNGKETTHKMVSSAVRSLKIQVDNLCQFLPQDRVVEFARSTPVDLLRETLRAAAPEKMLKWQADIQGLYRDKKGQAEAAQADTETLSNLENRQQALQADVDRIHERDVIIKQVEDLKKARVLAEYTEARARHDAAKERRKQAVVNLRRLEESSGPSLEAVNRKIEYADQVEIAIDGRSNAVQQAESKTQKLATEIDQANEDIKGYDARRTNEKSAQEKKKKEMANCRSRITQLQGDLASKPPEFNAAVWNQKIRSEEHRVRELEADSRQVQEKLNDIRAQGRQVRANVEKLAESKHAINTREGQQVNFMKRHFEDVGKAWDWLNENQDQFEKEVFGPPMISCAIKDERYSDQVQALLQTDDFLCFTVQTTGDYKKLSDQLYSKLSLSVNVRTCIQPREAFEAPLSASEATAMGLDGFAIDFLDGPAPVLAMLCAEKRLHQSAVTLREHSDEEYERLVNQGRVTQWAAGKQSFVVRRRREYGAGAMTIVSKNIQPGRFWQSQPVDAGERTELERQLREAQGEFEALKQEKNNLDKQQKQIKEEQTTVDDKIDQIKSEKGQLQREYAKYQSLPDKLAQEERQKEIIQEALNSFRQTLIDLEYEWDEAVIKRAKLVLRHHKSLGKLQEARQSLLEAKICHIEAKSDVEGLKERNADIMKRLEEERSVVQEAVAETERAKEAGKEVQARVAEILAEKPDGWHEPRDEQERQAEQERAQAARDHYGSLAEGKTTEVLDMEVSAEEAKLELIHEANPNVLREFRRREQEIDKLRRKMEATNGKLEKVTAELNSMMAKFEPQLDQLVAKINDAFAYNFEQISCAGEVRVHKEEDFDQWALDIMVRFRENETLQQLNAHRQSGGERAVSTIFYLMAMQSMAQSPFRVVDEINQGMDPRNERMVHERMVEIACKEHTSQYFLITPKLLTGLRYDEKMRVLCIASGEYMPTEGRKLDFGRCLGIQKTLMAAG